MKLDCKTVSFFLRTRATVSDGVGASRLPKTSKTTVLQSMMKQVHGLISDAMVCACNLTKKFPMKVLVIFYLLLSQSSPIVIINLIFFVNIL